MTVLNNLSGSTNFVVSLTVVGEKLKKQRQALSEPAWGRVELGYGRAPGISKSSTGTLTWKTSDSRSPGVLHGLWMVWCRYADALVNRRAFSRPTSAD